MKRWAIRIAVFLLLGAIVNVAVAWGLNLMRYPIVEPGWSHLPTEGDLEWWRAHAPAGFPAHPAGAYETRLFGRQNVLMYEREADADSNTLGDNVGRFRCGWPLSSMESAFWVNRKTRSVVEQNRIYVPRGCPMAGRWLSTEPLWPGFATNTLFYAAILWALFAMSAALRRKRRIKRGLCPKCAYPVGESPVCTECGAAVSPHMLNAA